MCAPQGSPRCVRVVIPRNTPNGKTAPTQPPLLIRCFRRSWLCLRTRRHVCLATAPAMIPNWEPPRPRASHVRRATHRTPRITLQMRSWNCPGQQRRVQHVTAPPSGNGRTANMRRKTSSALTVTRPIRKHYVWIPTTSCARLATRIRKLNLPMPLMVLREGRVRIAT